jgi:hypothetical protein
MKHEAIHQKQMIKFQEKNDKDIWLVVLTILKNMNVNGKDYPIYYGK